MGSTKPVSVSFTDETLAKLDRVAKLFNLSRSTLLQHLINEMPDPIDSSLALTRPDIIKDCDATVEQACEIMAGFTKMPLDAILANVLKAQLTLYSLMECALATENAIIRKNEDG